MPKIEVCVRCGSPGRYMESFLCAVCYRDPARIPEQRAVEAAAWGDYQAMRKMLRDWFGWTGGWSRRETTGRET